MLDRSRFPRVARYLDDLPDGVESHPQALVKGTTVRAAVFDRVVHGAAGLPSAIADWFRSPPLASSWVRSVHAQALFLAVADDHAMTDDQFGDWTYRLQKQLYGSVIYRSLAAVATPPMLLTGARMRWGAFHRGTEIEVAMAEGRTAAQITMFFPRSLYTLTHLHGFARGIQAVLELSNALSASVVIDGSTSTTAKFDARWRTR